MAAHFFLRELFSWRVDVGWEGKRNRAEIVVIIIVIVIVESSSSSINVVEVHRRHRKRSCAEEGRKHRALASSH